MNTTTEAPVISDQDYLALEVAYLKRRLDERELDGDYDPHAIAVSLATIAEVVHHLRIAFDPERDTCARLAMSQGYYRHWPFLDE